MLWTRDERFKTFRLVIHADRPLGSPRDVAARSLLPQLLVHGTRSYPDRPALARAMESAFGASASPSAHRSGETASFSLALDAVAGRFLPGEPELLEPGLKILAELAVGPTLQDGGFPAVTFDRVKGDALASVRSRRDDKGARAEEEAIALAFAGEPYAVRDDGGLEGLQPLTAQDPIHALGDFLSRGKVFAVVGGALPAGDGWLSLLDQWFDALPERQPEPLPPIVQSSRPAGEVLRGQDTASGNQAWQVCVFRLPPPETPEAWVATMLAVGLWGGGPHARLFREVREARSLAYAISARPDLHKGVVTVRAGIDAAAADAVEACVLEQLTALARGDFTEDELNTAKAALLGPVGALSDSLAGTMRFLAEQWRRGNDQTLDERMALYAACSAEAVASAAAAIALDTVFLLAPESTEGQVNS